VTAEELDARIRAETAPFILDVRSDAEYEAGHIPGAAHIPFQQVGRRASEIPVTKDSEIVVYCGHGPRAWMAGAVLRRHGFTNVKYLKGHWAGWQRR
jgi:rhodanese-related sulfurtransferase